jgi:alpha,alpha-trehalose phosphorylase
MSGAPPFKRVDTTIDRERFPVDPWQWIEATPGNDPGFTGTLLAVGNGYLGMRADHTPDPQSSGTFVNGFHETFEIQHAENAYGLARTGQTLLEAPDGKSIELRVDDEVLRLDPNAEDRSAIANFNRAIDFRTGVLSSSFVWHLRDGGTVEVATQRMVSFERRHLGAQRLEFTVVDRDATVTITSWLVNRQDIAAAPSGAQKSDPRGQRRFDRRVLDPVHRRHDDGPFGGTIVLGYRAINSGMTLSAASRHTLSAEGITDPDVETSVIDDIATTTLTFDVTHGDPVELVKLLAYHSAGQIADGRDDATPEELGDRAVATLDDASSDGWYALTGEQRGWLEAFWKRADIQIDGDPAAQQAIRWNLYQLAQASAQVGERGIAAKAVTAGGYEGHYFWDTEMYVLPLLAYTHPVSARDLLKFRHRLLPAARRRAEQLSQRGALYAWRTINGEEASGYFPAGTAQYHIDADVVHAIDRYVAATGDVDFLASHAAEIAAEVARLYADLGFYDTADPPAFHIHCVTGPDEYTALVDDNLYTNVMARFALRFAADTIAMLERDRPDDYAALVSSINLTPTEVDDWRRAAEAMYIGYDEKLAINPQDNSFLSCEPWDWDGTPPEKYPLLLHVHPLVIYRHQVLKQADVVLAMFVRGHEFAPDLQRRNFDYYDPITSGDSSLSACVQAIVAAQVGRDDVAFEYLEQSLYLDLANTHGNTDDGAHIANVGGVWAALVHGVAGMRDDGRALRVDPSLPPNWTAMRFDLLRRGSVLEVAVDASGAKVNVRSGDPVPVLIGDEIVEVAAGTSIQVTGHSR